MISWSLIKMMHKRNNEGGESQCFEQLPKPLSLISAGNLETDKRLFFLRNKEQMSNFFLLTTSLNELSIHLPQLEQPPSHMIIQPLLWAFKTPPSNIWPALHAYIFILLLLARSKGLLCFQEARDFADCWKVKKQNHLISPTVTL